MAVQLYLEYAAHTLKNETTLKVGGFRMLTLIETALAQGPWFVVALLSLLIAYEAVRGKKGP